MNRGTRILVALGIALVVYRFGLAIIGDFASALVVGLISGGVGWTLTGWKP